MFLLHKVAASLIKLIAASDTKYHYGFIYFFSIPIVYRTVNVKKRIIGSIIY